jgi:outer membrane protein assembly factor BamB
MKAFVIAALAFVCVATSASGETAPAWRGYAANAQHTAKAPAAGQALTKIQWSMPVDLDPPFEPHRKPGGGELLIHYASPMITHRDTVLVPVKTTAQGNFEIRAVNGATGAKLWKLTTDYVLPPYDWTPPVPAHLTAQNRLYLAGDGGTVYFRDKPDAKHGTSGQLAFYGIANYTANKNAFNQNVMIDTPITADEKGNIYFGFVVLGSNPLNLKSGIARMDSSGNGTWISAGDAASDQEITQVAMNCAPAISADGSTIYITVSDGEAGYLVGLDATTLQPKYRTKLLDPVTKTSALIDDDSSASPTIGPDGDVYYGVLEAGVHNCRGWMLAYSSALTTTNTPGSFGWDDTVSIVPSASVPQYRAKGSYLLMSKYNNYLDCDSGDGHNRIAILDPRATQKDEFSSATVMKEVETILDPHQVQGEPEGAVYEWCINSAVVDRKNKSVIANAEDGYSYRWDLTSNTLSQTLMLNQPLGEAYTPTLIGPDGMIYAINDATLYAIGATLPR